MAEALKNPFVWLIGAGVITALYAILFPDALSNVAEDILRGIPGSKDDTVEDYKEVEKTPCAKCGRPGGVVIVDYKLLCADCAFKEVRS